MKIKIFQKNKIKKVYFFYELKFFLVRTGRDLNSQPYDLESYALPLRHQAQNMMLSTELSLI